MAGRIQGQAFTRVSCLRSSYTRVAFCRSFASAVSHLAQSRGGAGSGGGGDGGVEKDDFYALLLSSPLPTSARTTRTGPQPSALDRLSSSKPDSLPPKALQPVSPSQDTESSANPEELSTAERARMVFGSRQTGPAARERRAREREAAATTVAGIRVPPRPAEPDNCCMSGCVNCVWDLYREELEEWAERKRDVEMRLAEEQGGRDDTDGALRAQQRVTGGAMRQAAVSMDDDGGGSETNWDAEDALLPSSSSSLFQSVPVGIREFMRTEKRLGQKRRKREAADAEI